MGLPPTVDVAWHPVPAGRTVAGSAAMLVGALPTAAAEDMAVRRMVANSDELGERPDAAPGEEVAASIMAVTPGHTLSCMSDELQLFIQQFGQSQLVSGLGRLVIHNVEQHPTEQGLGFDVEFFQSQIDRFNTDPPTHWVSFAATVETQQRPYRQVGKVTIEEKQRPAFSPPPLNTLTRVKWTWQLTPEDVELVEQTRNPDREAPIWLSLRIDAVAQFSEGTFGVTSATNDNFRIESSKWRTLLKSIGFTVGPSGVIALTGANLEHASWHEAAKRLEPARKHLREGEDYAALEACLGELEKLVTAPFNAENWKTGPLVGMPEQKRDSVAAWIGGLATTLNRVGHHKDRRDRASTGDLKEMPLDHWEAELIVQSAHSVLAYALRLRSS
jgi:hypothetical protein